MMKHAPVRSRSLGTAQLPDDGDADNNIGALVPRLIGHAAVLVKGPNTLLSPSLNVVVTLIIAAPPQHDNGNAVPGRFGPSAARVPRTRLQLAGETLVIGIEKSPIPSPFVSQTTVAAVVTVFPGRITEMPVSAATVLQMILISFGKSSQTVMLVLIAQ